MPHGVHLLNELVAATAAFGSAALLSIRRQYRTAAAHVSHLWDNDTVFTVTVTGLTTLWRCFGARRCTILSSLITVAASQAARLCFFQGPRRTTHRPTAAGMCGFHG